ncbi:hypothetical protein PoB_006885700 [Plakobranchus ocellatus]|uniref:Uncharacterized protein n=1 Tax=Plakobranchus ocellatus TaxID=259542 RepID=A0AAV4DE81_9GAST|nr:hypothetical protein PoB_006885700 [Plakobranchus ocellatus]
MRKHLNIHPFDDDKPFSHSTRLQQADLRLLYPQSDVDDRLKLTTEWSLQMTWRVSISQVLTQKGHINGALLIRQVKYGRSERVSIVSWFNNQSQQGMLCCSAVIYQKRHIDGLWHKPSNSRENHFTGGEEIDLIM